MRAALELRGRRQVNRVQRNPWNQNQQALLHQQLSKRYVLSIFNQSFN